MPTARSFTDGGNVIVYKGVRGSYTGYAYNEQAFVAKLLGKDPASPDKNEVVQSSGLGSRSARIECYADTSAERDALLGLLFKKVTHNDGIDGDRTVIVTRVELRIWVWSGGTPHWIVALHLRETP